jgi:hypothetical protein
MSLLNKGRYELNIVASKKECEKGKDQKRISVRENAHPSPRQRTASRDPSSSEKSLS